MKVGSALEGLTQNVYSKCRVVGGRLPETLHAGFTAGSLPHFSLTVVDERACL